MIELKPRVDLHFQESHQRRIPFHIQVNHIRQDTLIGLRANGLEFNTDLYSLAACGFSFYGLGNLIYLTPYLILSLYKDKMEQMLRSERKIVFSSSRK